MAVADQFLCIAVRVAPDVDCTDDSYVGHSSVARYR